MKILVTGGCGFIGSAFVDYCKDHRVMIVDKITYAAYTNKKEAIMCDIASPKMRDLVEQFNPEVIINFAAETHVTNSIRDPKPFIDSNIYGIFNLLEIVRYLNIPMIHISTDEVYGDATDYITPRKETDKLNPSSPYSATKAAGEMLIASYNRTYGTDVRIVRPANNYGLNQNDEKMLPMFIKWALAKETIVLHQPGTQERNWCHTNDTCDAIMTVLEKGEPGGIYNIATEDTYSVWGCAVLINLLCDNSTNQRIGNSGRPGEDLAYNIDASKLEALGWKPKHKFAEELPNLIKHYGGAINEERI